MKEANGEQSPAGAPFERFKTLTKALVSVPKKEADEKEAEYQRKKARKKRKPA